MAYEQPGSSSDSSSGRMPLILGVAALVLAGVGAVVFFTAPRTRSCPCREKSRGESAIRAATSRGGSCA